MFIYFFFIFFYSFSGTLQVQEETDTNNGQQNQCSCNSPYKCSSRVKCKINNIENSTFHTNSKINYSTKEQIICDRRDNDCSHSSSTSCSSTSCIGDNFNNKDVAAVNVQSGSVISGNSSSSSKQHQNHDNFKLIQNKSDDVELSDHIQFLITEVSAPKLPSVQEKEILDDVDVVTEGKFLKTFFFFI